MFAYCGDNPINRFDSSGAIWDKICSWLNRGFGWNKKTVAETKNETPAYSFIGDFAPITIKSGVKNTTTISNKGSSTKPITVYCITNPTNWTNSAVGLKINMSNVSLTVNLSFDNIGISGSINNENSTKSLGARVNISEFKVGFIQSDTVQWDVDQSVTTYSSADVNGFWLLYAYALVQGGTAITEFGSTSSPSFSPTPVPSPAH